MNDWTDLTINDWTDLAQGFLRIIVIVYKQLQDTPVSLQSQNRLRELTRELELKQRRVEQIREQYRAGELRTNVKSEETGQFQTLVSQLARQRAELPYQEPLVLASDLSRHVDAFLSAGPHGPGDPPPDWELSAKR